MSDLTRRCIECGETKWRSAFKSSRGHSLLCRTCRSWDTELRRVDRLIADAKVRAEQTARTIAKHEATRRTLLARALSHGRNLIDRTRPAPREKRGAA
jgi:hypothetical protein